MEPKYKENQFIQHKNVPDSFHGRIIEYFLRNNEYVYEIDDSGETMYLNEQTIEKFYEIV